MEDTFKQSQSSNIPRDAHLPLQFHPKWSQGSQLQCRLYKSRKLSIATFYIGNHSPLSGLVCKSKSKFKFVCLFCVFFFSGETKYLYIVLQVPHNLTIFPFSAFRYWDYSYNQSIELYGLTWPTDSFILLILVRSDSQRAHILIDLGRWVGTVQMTRA